VLLAVQQANKLIQREAHYAERPIAQLSAIQLNKLSSKKNTKKFGLMDLCLYATKEDRNLPKGQYGAAMLKARDNSIFPSWALFIYKELAQAASGTAPEQYICTCEDVVVLAPTVEGTHLHGLVIAQETASNEIRQLVAPDGSTFTVQIPVISTKIIADEEMPLHILSAHQLTVAD
jgi:hypothetical protein